MLVPPTPPPMMTTRASSLTCLPPTVIRPRRAGRLAGRFFGTWRPDLLGVLVIANDALVPILLLQPQGRGNCDPDGQRYCKYSGGELPDYERQYHVGLEVGSESQM